MTSPRLAFRFLAAKRWFGPSALFMALFGLGCGNDDADSGATGGASPDGGSGATSGSGGSGGTGGTGGTAATGGGSGAPGATAGTGGASGGNAGTGGASGGNVGTGGGTYQAAMDSVCALDDAIGLVEIVDFDGQMYVQGSLYDVRDPWVGAPELTTLTCAHHHYNRDACGVECEAGKTCSINGECVPERRTIKDATLTLSADGEEREYAANPEIGGISGELDIGTKSSSFAMLLRWGDYEVVLAPMPVASGELTNLRITTEGDYSAPGALEATWQPSPEGAFLRTTIPINHHAAGPTFTECVAPDDSGSFRAEAEMVNPLAVITGLEFQGVDHVHIAAAETPAGCIEFRFGPRLLVFPE